MKTAKEILGNFTRTEKLLWASSVSLILLSFLLFKDRDPLSLSASLIGVTSLIFCAKGNPIGQLLMLVFSVLYGIISYSYAYYGEMITYLGMSAPMAAIALIAWLKNPYKGNRAEVEVNRIGRREWLLLVPLALAVTIAFYYILGALNTANLIPSTLSVTTSFSAAYLTARRSEYYALAYAANDMVLIVMWIMATLHDTVYFSVIVCFTAFLANDLYGFINWRRMRKRQRAESCAVN